MTDSNQIDASMLVLKMVGGSLDGKLLPIATQKCFLTGGEKNNHDQCAIIRGPSGTAIKSSESIFVNDHPDTLHWLSEGDTIRIGQTKMIVEQLGSFGKTTVSAAAETSTLGTETQAQTQTAVQEPEVAAPTAFDSETFAQSTELETPIESNDASQELETTSELNLSPIAPSEKSDTHSELRDFLNNTELQATESEGSTEPANHAELPRQEEPSIEPNLSNELLERALNSLKNSSDEPTEEGQAEPQVQSEPQDDAVEMSTEQNVDQQLDDIQNQIESQIQSYDSLPEVDQPQVETETPVIAPEQVANQESSVEEADANPNLTESVVDETSFEDVAAPQQSIEEIMSRLRSSGMAQAEEPAEPTEPVSEEFLAPEPVDLSEPAMPMPIESPAEETSLEVAPIEPEQIPTPTEVEPQPQSIQDVMSLLSASAESSIETDDDQALEPSQSIEPELASPTTMVPEVHVDEPQVAEETQADPEETTHPIHEDENSVAAVLARMQSAGQLSEFNMSEEKENTSLPAGQSVTEPIRQHAEPEVNPEEANAGGDVQDYMNQLFQRLRGSDAPESVLPPAEEAPAVTTPKAPVNDPPVEPVKEVERVLTPTEYVPKQQAPEEKAHLQAMRQLANQQKDAAVQISTSKKSQIQQTINQCVAVACFVISVFLGRMATSMTDPLAIVSFGCGVASLMGFFRYVFGLRHKPEDEESEEEAVADSEAIEEPTAVETQP